MWQQLFGTSVREEKKFFPKRIARKIVKDICICILAHNEQKHIAETIKAIAANATGLDCDIKVYANGCTDNTVAIVRDLAHKLPNLFLRELSVASKPHSWNVAFRENSHAVLIFADGDVVPEDGAVQALWASLNEPRSKVILVGCSLWPRRSGLSIGQRLVGFLQIPLRQTFLAGGLYGVRREFLLLEFQKNNISGVPLGIVGEDLFLQLATPHDRFSIISHRFFYEPPTFKDYWKYLARMRWQEEQLVGLYRDLYFARPLLCGGYLAQLVAKLSMDQGVKRLLLGIASSGLRIIMETVFSSKIDKSYREMGLVDKNGENILSKVSRSGTTK